MSTSLHKTPMVYWRSGSHWRYGRRTIEIDRSCFLFNVDKNQARDLEAALGYFYHARRGLTMAGDRRVTYHRSTLHGQPVYYFRRLGVDYVFVDPTAQFFPRANGGSSNNKHTTKGPVCAA